MSHSSPTGLAHHFDDLEQQQEASTLGMWTFLITEILFFGGLFLGYIIMRWKYPEAFAAASEELNPVLGGLNTGVLLISSLTMALAVRAAQEGKSKLTTYLLIVTMVLGATFLGVKGVEYYDKWEHHHIPGANFHFQSDRPEFANVDPMKAQSFFFLYFAMTGIHAAHMIIGLVLVGIIARKAWRGKYTPDYYNPVEVTGLYWHFVDLVWIFLYPLLYLIHPK